MYDSITEVSSVPVDPYRIHTALGVVVCIQRDIGDITMDAIARPIIRWRCFVFPNRRITLVIDHHSELTVCDAVVLAVVIRVVELRRSSPYSRDSPEVIVHIVPGYISIRTGIQYPGTVGVDAIRLVDNIVIAIVA